MICLRRETLRHLCGEGEVKYVHGHEAVITGLCLLLEARSFDYLKRLVKRRISDLIDMGARNSFISMKLSKMKKKSSLDTTFIIMDFASPHKTTP